MIQRSGTIAPPQHRQLVTNILTWKRSIRRFETGEKRFRREKERLAADLDRYSRLPPESKLHLRGWAVKAEALVKETDESLQADRKIADRWYLDLEQCMRAYDASPFRNWHEIAQLLSISHVLLDRFLKAHEMEHVSLEMCALHHAEVWGEKEYTRSGGVRETPSRDSILHQAVMTIAPSLIKTNSAIRYRFWKGVDNLFPGLLPPRWVQPERNFEVIADSLEGDPVNPTKDSQTELWP
jgi:hypothetical protein